MRVLSIIQPSPHRPRRAAGMAALLTSSILGASVFIACGHVDGDESIDSPAPATEGNATGAAIVGDPAADGITIEWLPAKVERHRAAIEAASAATRVDPNVVALMVLVESGGDERATSPYGARGLLQLMPETATKVAARTGIALDHPDALFDPETNLQLGTALLAELLASDMVRAGAAAKSTAPREIAWAAYNAGNRAVREHLELGHPLPEEAQGYVALLGSLYAERDEPESASYDAWRARTER